MLYVYVYVACPFMRMHYVRVLGNANKLPWLWRVPKVPGPDGRVV